MFLVDKQECARIFKLAYGIPEVRSIFDQLCCFGKRMTVCNHSIRVGYQSVQNLIDYFYQNEDYSVPWSEHDLVLTMVASLMHDVGKLFVPNALLEYRGRLSAEDFDCYIKPHPIYSEQMTETLAQRRSPYDLHLIPAIVRGHHNWKKTGGYPNPNPRPLRELTIGSDEWWTTLIQQIVNLADFTDSCTHRSDWNEDVSDLDLAELLFESFSGETELIGFAISTLGINNALRTK